MAATAPALVRILDDVELAQDFGLEWQMMGEQRRQQELTRICERYGDDAPIARQMYQEMKKPGRWF